MTRTEIAARVNRLLTLREAVDDELKQLANIARTADAPRKTATCGTDSGYYRHRRRSEEPCRGCRRAHADDVRARYWLAKVRDEQAAS